MRSLEILELLSYLVTIVGFPLAIVVFIYEQRRERENEEESVYQLLSDNYEEFLRTALRNSELRLFSAEETPQLSDEQRERMFIIFSMLISLFERAYLLLYDPKMTLQQRRRWLSWDDYMREWCRRADFRRLLPLLLNGEDPEFVAYFRALATQELSGVTDVAAAPSPGSRWSTISPIGIPGSSVAANTRYADLGSTKGLSEADHESVRGRRISAAHDDRSA